jgi:Family of unknown function (DUF5872)
MSKTAQRTDPKLWDKVKSEVTKRGKGGEPGQWSARKAQLAVQEYKKRGGGYIGGKPDDNQLKRWTDEDWGTKSGRNSRDSGERYLPKRARAELTDAEYARTSAKKRADTKSGKQFSAQPEDVAKKTARKRSAGKSPAGSTPPQSRDERLTQARYLDIEGRSTMLKAELEKAVRLAN